MSVGVDLSGRAFRWCRFGEDPKVSYVPLGCPQYPGDPEERTTWDNSFAFRPQICTENPDVPAKLISVEDAWDDLRGNDPDKYGEAARNIVAAIADNSRCPSWEFVSPVAFAIPNRLNEDAQDALLQELRAAGYTHPTLLWRPVAIMLQWLHEHPDYEPAVDRHVWVFDLDAPFPEMTKLRCRYHARDNTWRAPVRECPMPVPNQTHWLHHAWSVLFSGVPERNQLRVGPCAPGVQEAIEKDDSDLAVWLYKRPAWDKVKVVRPRQLPVRLREELQQGMGHIKIKEHDVIIIHGWLGRLYESDIRAVLSEVHIHCTIHFSEASIVAKGAAFFAERLCDNIPTYYDQIPQYSMWCKNPAGVVGWVTIVPAHIEVEAGEVWLKMDIRDGPHPFVILCNRSDLSLLVQRMPVLSDEDVARRLKVSLDKPLANDLPLRIDAVVQAAQGSAKFKVTTRNGERPFTHDRRTFVPSVELSYGLNPDKAFGLSTSRVPKHIGYLEPQPVIGRIYDCDKHVSLLTSLVNGHATLADVLAYRADLGGGVVEDLYSLALERWGWHAAPKQPTRGLFGTKRIENRQISELASQLAVSPAINSNALLQNYLHTFCSDAYKDATRNRLSGGAVIAYWNHLYAPGYVMGEQPDDLNLLIDYSLAHNMGTHLLIWSFFRMLCWHAEVSIDPVRIRSYLEGLVHYLNEETHAGKEEGKLRSFSAFAVLFSLRVREVDPAFLLCGDHVGLRDSLLALLSIGRLSHIIFPPTMVANMVSVHGTFSDYVQRFIRKSESIEDRELGAAIGMMR